MSSPREALAELRAMAADGHLDEFCDTHGIHLPGGVRQRRRSRGTRGAT